MGCSGESCYEVMYYEWYAVCDFVVLSVVEACADYDHVKMFHVYVNFGVVVVVGVYVNVCVVICFLSLNIVM